MRKILGYCLLAIGFCLQAPAAMVMVTTNGKVLGPTNFPRLLIGAGSNVVATPTNDGTGWALHLDVPAAGTGGGAFDIQSNTVPALLSARSLNLIPGGNVTFSITNRANTTDVEVAASIIGGAASMADVTNVVVSYVTANVTNPIQALVNASSNQVRLVAGLAATNAIDYSSNQVRLVAGLAATNAIDYSSNAVRLVAGLAATNAIDYSSNQVRLVAGLAATNAIDFSSNQVRLVAGLAATNHVDAVLQSSTNYANAVTNNTIARTNATEFVRTNKISSVDGNIVVRQDGSGGVTLSNAMVAGGTFEIQTNTVPALLSARSLNLIPGGNVTFSVTNRANTTDVQIAASIVGGAASLADVTNVVVSYVTDNVTNPIQALVNSSSNAVRLVAGLAATNAIDYSSNAVRLVAGLAATNAIDYSSNQVRLVAGLAATNAIDYSSNQVRLVAGLAATNAIDYSSNQVRLVAGLAATNHADAVLQSSTNYAIGVTNSASVTNWINSRQPASANLTNWNTWSTSIVANPNMLLAGSAENKVPQVASGSVWQWADLPTSGANRQIGSAILTNLTAAGITNWIGAGNVLLTTNSGAITFTGITNFRDFSFTNAIGSNLILSGTQTVAHITASGLSFDGLGTGVAYLDNNTNLAVLATNTSGMLTNRAGVLGWMTIPSGSGDAGGTNARQFGSLILSNIHTIGISNVGSGTNILIRSEGGTNFVDTTGYLNNWSGFPTSTFAVAGMSNIYALASQTSSWTGVVGMTNQFALAGMSNIYALASQTTSWSGVVGMTNDFAKAGMTNQFALAGVTNSFALAGWTNAWTQVASTTNVVGVSNWVNAVSNLVQAKVVASAVGTNLATAASQQVDLSQDSTVSITNAVAGNVDVYMTNAVDRKYFVLRCVADGSARTLSFTNKASYTVNVIATNGFSVLTLPQMPVTANKIATVVGRVWVSGAVTNIDLFGNVQP